MNDKIRNLNAKDSARIKCDGPHALECCDAQATIVIESHWHISGGKSGQKGVSFFYKCAAHRPA